MEWDISAKALIHSIASGVTGDCTWALTGAAGNYTLTISGNGEMADYNSPGRANTPWYDYRNDIKTILIQEVVTIIGNYAFYGCSGLTSVTNLSATPQNINSNVFSDVTVSVLTLRVPASALEAYKAAPIWKYFGTIVAIE